MGLEMAKEYITPENGGGDAEGKEAGAGFGKQESDKEQKSKGV